MEKQMLNEEFRRMQRLAGLITENLDENLDEDVMTILNRNGIDDDYFEEMGGQEIEGGSEEWLDVISDITGKNAYEEEFDENDNEKIMDFISKLEELGIELI